MKTILATGSAGFIGAHVAPRLLNEGYRVIEFDDLNDYYDVNLKYSRLACLKQHPAYTQITADLADREAVSDLMSLASPPVMFNAARVLGELDGADLVLRGDAAGVGARFRRCKPGRFPAPSHVID